MNGPIEIGLYRTRGGGFVAQITEIGSFAYGFVAGNQDFWHLEDGSYVPKNSKQGRNGQPVCGPHALDLIERIPVKSDCSTERVEEQKG